MNHRERLAVLLVLALASCSGGAELPGSLPPGTVVIQDFRFSPDRLVVPAGTSVTWTNQESGVAHTTTADDRTWDSGLLQPGEFFTHRFERPGAFPYFCSIHPEMEAAVMVEG
ncbi:MAG: cupredoxin domain-containing protein [Actinomycetota bacterium]|nr:cupredoxin domain-containing protein [Actinomycetota bacterium]